eukprot:9468773-Pyramimonas_sp.AAC.2
MAFLHLSFTCCFGYFPRPSSFGHGFACLDDNIVDGVIINSNATPCQCIERANYIQIIGVVRTSSTAMLLALWNQ